jgi:hypothetical protein
MATKKSTKKTAQKTAQKSATKKPAPKKKKPHLTLVPKTTQTNKKTATKKSRKESIGDVFKRLLEAKEQRRKEMNPRWFNDSESQRENHNLKHETKFSRFNGPRRKAA